MTTVAPARRAGATLASGDWAATHADLLAATEYDAGFRLVIAGEGPC